ncbi:MAG TPA: hypothetical protein V6D22_03380 [Candidatus Obscuribacterales bacterium]
MKFAQITTLAIAAALIAIPAIAADAPKADSKPAAKVAAPAHKSTKKAAKVKATSKKTEAKSAK